MDPNTVLLCLLEALQDDDRDDAQRALEDLAGWTERGGFLPSWDTVAAHVDRQRAHTAAVDALAAQLPQAEPQTRYRLISTCDDSGWLYIGGAICIGEYATQAAAETAAEAAVIPGKRGPGCLRIETTGGDS